MAGKKDYIYNRQTTVSAYPLPPNYEALICCILIVAPISALITRSHIKKPVMRG
jgi:hypothetical protein